MNSTTELSFGDGARNDVTSAIDRVRVRMSRLIRPGRDRAAPALQPEVPGRDDERKIPAASPIESSLSSLAADLCTLEQIIEDSEDLLRQGWKVAADLNQLRRRCSRCEQVDVLPEALGTFQGLLNRCRHNLRAATRVVGNIKAGVASGRR